MEPAADEEEFLAVFAVGNLMLVEDEIVIFLIVLFVGDGAVIERFPLLVFYLGGGLEYLQMVDHAKRDVELSETGTVLKGIGSHPHGAFLNPVLGHIGYLYDGAA